MEIPGNEYRIKSKAVNKVDAPSKKGTVNKTATPNGTGAGEQIALSSKAKGIQKALEVAKSAPDIRTEKVSRIKAQIAAGEFHVDSEVLAERILKEIITESKFLD